MGRNVDNILAFGIRIPNNPDNKELVDKFESMPSEEVYTEEYLGDEVEKSIIVFNYDYDDEDSFIFLYSHGSDIVSTSRGGVDTKMNIPSWLPTFELPPALTEMFDVEPAWHSVVSESF